VRLPLLEKIRSVRANILHPKSVLLIGLAKKLRCEVVFTDFLLPRWRVLICTVYSILRSGFEDVDLQHILAARPMLAQCLRRSIGCADDRHACAYITITIVIIIKVFRIGLPYRLLWWFVICYILPYWFTSPRTVTHPGSNHLIASKPRVELTIYRSSD